MNREQIFTLIRDHLADELEVDPGIITEATRFREDLEADSLDLYTLVQELEDSYGVRSPTRRRPRSSASGRRWSSCSRAVRQMRTSPLRRAQAQTLSER